MNDKVFSHLSDPVKSKIIMEIHEQGRITTKQIAKIFDEIPQATLYRYIKKMHSDGILKTVDEIPVRGTVEKVYALEFDLNKNNESVIAENDGKAYLQMATLYMLGILREFKEYSDNADINLSDDGTGFSHVPIYATTDELTEILTQIKDVLSPHLSNPPGGERKLRNLCIIVTPPKSN